MSLLSRDKRICCTIHSGIHILLRHYSVANRSVAPVFAAQSLAIGSCHRPEDIVQHAAAHVKR